MYMAVSARLENIPSCLSHSSEAETGPASIADGSRPGGSTAGGTRADGSRAGGPTAGGSRAGR